MAVRSTSQAWLEMLHPYAQIKLVNNYGDEVLPKRCDKATTEGACRFVNNGAIPAVKPLLTSTGPVFIRFPRLRCMVHHGECILRRISEPGYGSNTRLVPAIIRAGQVRFLVKFWLTLLALPTLSAFLFNFPRKALCLLPDSSCCL